MNRATSTIRSLRAGCYNCEGPAARWTGANAQALAARHHDRTDHRTWCTVQLDIVYGTCRADPRQHDIEAAIAASAPTSSGGEPDATPLTDPDTPTCSSAGVSAPKGRSVETRARGRKPETMTP